MHALEPPFPRRKTYKFSSSISQGGYLYAHRVDAGKIVNREGLRNALSAIVKRLTLIDVTVKIYDRVLFLFFMMRPTVKPLDVIGSIQRNIEPFGKWSNAYLYQGVYDLQEEHVRKDLKRYGFDYDLG